MSGAKGSVISGSRRALRGKIAGSDREVSRKFISSAEAGEAALGGQTERGYLLEEMRLAGHR